MLETIAIIDLIAIIIGFVGLCVSLICTMWLKHRGKKAIINQTKCQSCEHQKVCTYIKLYKDMCEQINEYMINFYGADDSYSLIEVDVQCVEYDEKRGQ